MGLRLWLFCCVFCLFFVCRVIICVSWVINGENNIERMIVVVKVVFLWVDIILVEVVVEKSMNVNFFLWVSSVICLKVLWCCKWVKCVIK